MISMRLLTWFFGKHVGTDALANRYYITNRPYRGRERRWVMYQGIEEASKVPPEWHAWLHHQTDHIPQQKEEHRYAWQKAHLPNLTGTPYAYKPKGHLLRGGTPDVNTGSYEPWQPGDHSTHAA